MKRAEGFITEIDPDRMQAKVRFPEHGDIESDWLQLLNRQGGYFNIDKDTYVGCLMDDSLEDGWIIGTLETDDVSFDTSGADVYAKQFTDGTSVIYDRENHKLVIHLKGEGEVDIDKSLKVKISDGYEIQGDVKITGKLEVTKDIETQMNLKAGAQVEAKGNVKDSAGTLMQLRMAHKTHTHPSPPAPVNPVVTSPAITTA